jgi:hypothetical protein
MANIWTWDPIPIPPQPLLAHLRTRVLERSEKRSPKWKFRLAPDLVLQVQPKLTTALLRFDCKAVMCENATKELLTTPLPKAGRDHWDMRFELRTTVPEQWVLKPRAIGYRPLADRERRFELRDRTVEAFHNGTFDQLRPEIMLGSHCMFCGKGLTDPVSQARFIGPECAGTASENLPFILDTAA